MPKVVCRQCDCIFSKFGYPGARNFCFQQFASYYSYRYSFTKRIFSITISLYFLSAEDSPSDDNENNKEETTASDKSQYVKSPPQTETGSRRMMPMRALDALYRSHKFPNEPDSKEILDRFDAPTHIGYLYGQLVWGWFIAPLDGEYIFYTACDDACDLYMSPDEGKDHIRKIISQNRWSLHNQWDK